MATNYQLLH